MADIPTPRPAYRKVVAALAESEDRYRMLVEGVRRYAIFMLDPVGIILTWNRGMQELLGYDRDEIVGQSGAVLFSAPVAFRKELAQAKTSDESIAEHLNIRSDKSAFTIRPRPCVISKGVLSVLLKSCAISIFPMIGKATLVRSN